MLARIKMVSNLRILDMLVRFMPILRLLSHRNLSKPSALRLTDTRETWELSIAYKKNREKKMYRFSNNPTCSWMPVSVQSQVASFKRSFRDSSTYGENGVDQQSLNF